MTSWEELTRRLDAVQDAVARLRMDARAASPQYLWDETTACYTRAYLVLRLPAEVERTRRTRRPLGLALMRFARPCFDTAAHPLVARVVRTFLDPVEVPIRFADDALMVLMPETAASGVAARLDVLLDGAALAGLCPRSEIQSAYCVYEGDARSPAELVEELEGALQPAAELGPPAHLSAQSPPERPTDSHGGPRSADGPRQVAVGFADGRKMPVSFWYDGELFAIHAVLDETVEASGVTLRVVCNAGEFRLSERDGKWFAERVR